MHPEERRIAGLLRELIAQGGAPLDVLEKRLGWEPGRLSSLLEGGLRLGFEDVLEILPLLETTPTEFFAWLYGFGYETPKEKTNELQGGSDRGLLGEVVLERSAPGDGD